MSQPGMQMPDMVARQASDHGQALGRVQHGVEHGILLGVVQCRGFPRAAQRDQACDFGLPQVLNQLAQNRVIHAVRGIVVKGGDDGHPDPRECRHV